MRWKKWFVSAWLLLLAALAAAALQEQAGEERVYGNPLGMVLIDIADEETAASYHVEECGVYVLAVEENSQAYHAGLRSGDRIISIGGTPIASCNDWEKTQRQLPSETMIRVDFAPHSQQQVLSTDLLWRGQKAVQ